jgi:triphosphoribosyl-dephospho-CoA synthetase
MEDAMTVMAKPVTAKGALILDKKILAEAGLGKQVRIIVKRGEIIVTEPLSEIETTLEALAGCLGEEPVSEYDFRLEPGGMHEAR